MGGSDDSFGSESSIRSSVGGSLIEVEKTHAYDFLKSLGEFGKGVALQVKDRLANFFIGRIEAILKRFGIGDRKAVTRVIKNAVVTTIKSQMGEKLEKVSGKMVNIVVDIAIDGAISGFEALAEKLAGSL